MNERITLTYPNLEVFIQKNLSQIPIPNKQKAIKRKRNSRNGKITKHASTNNAATQTHGNTYGNRNKSN